MYAFRRYVLCGFALVDTTSVLCGFAKVAETITLCLPLRNKIRLFFQALGWQSSTDEAKDHAFSSKFQALGVEFDLSTMHQGYCSVGNTPSCKAEFSSRIDDIR